MHIVLTARGRGAVKALALSASLGLAVLAATPARAFDGIGGCCCDDGRYDSVGFGAAGTRGGFGIGGFGGRSFAGPGAGYGGQDDATAGGGYGQGYGAIGGGYGGQGYGGFGSGSQGYRSTNAGYGGQGYGTTGGGYGGQGYGAFGSGSRGYGVSNAGYGRAEIGQGSYGDRGYGRTGFGAGRQGLAARERRGYGGQIASGSAADFGHQGFGPRSRRGRDLGEPGLLSQGRDREQQRFGRNGPDSGVRGGSAFRQAGAGHRRRYGDRRAVDYGPGRGGSPRRYD